MEPRFSWSVTSPRRVLNFAMDSVESEVGFSALFDLVTARERNLFFRFFFLIKKGILRFQIATELDPANDFEFEETNDEDYN